MKPDWKDAPSWANYLAMTEMGNWYWFENKPYIIFNCSWAAEGRSERHKEAENSWRGTLEERP